MRNTTYLIHSNYLVHYAKGQTKKNPKYIEKKNGVYIYPKGMYEKEDTALRERLKNTTNPEHRKAIKWKIYDNTNKYHQSLNYGMERGLRDFATRFDKHEPFYGTTQQALDRNAKLRAPENKIVRQGQASTAAKVKNALRENEKYTGPEHDITRSGGFDSNAYRKTMKTNPQQTREELLSNKEYYKTKKYGRSTPMDYEDYKKETKTQNTVNSLLSMLSINPFAPKVSENDAKDNKYIENFFNKKKTMSKDELSKKTERAIDNLFDKWFNKNDNDSNKTPEQKKKDKNARDKAKEIGKWFILNNIFGGSFR